MDVGHNRDVNGGLSADDQLRLDLERSEYKRKQLAESLSSLQSRLNTIMRAVSDIIYTLDEEGYITFVNDGVERIGFSPADLIGVNIFDIVHPEDREKAVFRLNERRRGDRGTQAHIVRFVTKGLTEKSDAYQGHMSDAVCSLTVTAEGQYRYRDDNSMDFVGTIGIARDNKSREWSLPSGKPSADKPVSGIDGLFIPVCANCKNVRNEKGGWETIEHYLHRKLGLKFTHSICPVCAKKLFPDIANEASLE